MTGDVNRKDRMEKDRMEIGERVRELEVLDPGAGDGFYWARFHRTVMERATHELARRREMLSPTLTDALSGWARLVLPAAAAAAAVAGSFLLNPGESQTARVVVDDVLDLPSVLAEDPDSEVTIAFSALAVVENF